MGRKKKKVMKPWCWYCNRDFDDEKILIQHQKAKHFKCHICHKKLYTGPGLQIHCMQVHKENIDKVPNAVPGRHDIEIEIYGMEGIPEADLKSHQEKVAGDEKKKEEKKNSQEPSTSQLTIPVSAMATMAKMPGMMPGPGMMAGMMPGQMPMPPMPPIPGMPGMPPFGMMPGMSVPMMRPMPPMMPNMTPSMMPGMMRPPVMAPASTTVSSTANESLVPPTISSTPSSSQAKPLFPSAAATTTSMPSTGLIGPHHPVSKAVGPVISKPSPTVSAQPSTTTITSAPPTVKTTSVAGKVSSSSATSKIMHPDEDISLEEIRSSLQKYAAKQVTKPVSLPNTSSPMMMQQRPQGMPGLMGQSPMRPHRPLQQGVGGGGGNGGGGGGGGNMAMGMQHQMQMHQGNNMPRPLLGGMPSRMQMGQSRPMYQPPSMMQQQQQHRMPTGPRPPLLQLPPGMMRPGNSRV
ncbi:BUB3-interacting and GLEBS motif-containing protein ZNF207-like [Anneissia japonica]|uniref:BUB3-interacting and GLEBS motif-containing protein ZNF207-like n=1 Tax=Anneissia japonica TaxID=1529436 RepID=UPI0014259D04|nr:BUB3-interacting and GLEBS motif-containing protein ZNF207-like [Anneissia japonica]